MMVITGDLARHPVCGAFPGHDGASGRTGPPPPTPRVENWPDLQCSNLLLRGRALGRFPA
ncbi:Plant regulator RWP-RK family protein, putative isoform 2 [Anopheles sinensis]|uniref:Plant regulator RWP-RK family protein, putative isoform 2 n=1 Tax=Anopheles sinensis TaxID=74873 RepID=A0A084VU03_ANOSI|nr:Plant regulator RWP-RK family protein, putative isoform 2 [Anopheles sinensis]